MNKVSHHTLAMRTTLAIAPILDVFLLGMHEFPCGAHLVEALDVDPFFIEFCVLIKKNLNIVKVVFLVGTREGPKQAPCEYTYC